MTQDNFSLKESIIELRDEQKISNVAHIKMAVTLENVEILLKKIGVTIDDHETRLQKQEGFQGKVLMVWTFIIFLLTTVANKVLANINL